MAFHTKYVKTGKPFGCTFMPLSETPEPCGMRFCLQMCGSCVQHAQREFTLYSGRQWGTGARPLNMEV